MNHDIQILLDPVRKAEDPAQEVFSERFEINVGNILGNWTRQGWITQQDAEGFTLTLVTDIRSLAWGDLLVERIKITKETVYISDASLAVFDQDLSRGFENLIKENPNKHLSLFLSFEARDQAILSEMIHEDIQSLLRVGSCGNRVFDFGGVSEH